MPFSIEYGSPTLASRGMVRSQALKQLVALQEDYRAANSINILSEDGLNHIISDPVVFSDYTTRLIEGADDHTSNALQVIAENSRHTMLQESMNSGVNPITALSLPILRVTYPKIAVREGLPTEPVEKPSFKVPTRRPYVVDTATMEKAYLPKALRTHGDLFGLPKLSEEPIALTNGSVQNLDILTNVNKDWKQGDSIDVDFRVVELTFGGEAYPVDIALTPNNNVLTGRVKVKQGTDEIDVDVLGTVDRQKGLFTLVTMGDNQGTPVQAESVKIQGYVSSEMNNSTTQVGFDITSEELNIPTGQPIESPINIQHMTDVMAMYQIDATMAHLETMSTVLAQTIDRKGVEHIERSFQKDPSVSETFNLQPPTFD